MLFIRQELVCGCQVWMSVLVCSFSFQVSTEYGLLFVVTKYGYLYMCDMETAMCLCCTRISVDVIFTSTLNTDTQGILGVTRGGQVCANKVGMHQQ